MTDDIVVNFELDSNPEITVDYELGQSGGISNHNDLIGRDDPDQHPISSITNLENELSQLDDRITSDHSEITDIGLTIQSYGDIVTHSANDFASASQGVKADTALQPESNISLLTNNVGYITNSALNGYATENYVTSRGYITISALEGYATENWVTSQGYLTDSSLTNYATISYVDLADNNLQSQIDAISSASDVTDIVGTYEALQNYDTTNLKDNDIIKVLQDESQNDETTYYRWIIVDHIGSWNLIGEEGPYLTLSAASSTYVPQSRTINNKVLSSNINLTASDVGALSDNTVIPTVNDATLTIQSNGTTIGTFSANASSNVTANITVPTDTGDLSNNAGFITSSSLPTVNNPTITFTQGGTTKGTITLNQSSNETIALDAGGSAPTNMVTTDTDQDITSTKTFIGEKRIKFKQSQTADKLGFTLYNSSNTELGAFEWRPNTVSGGALLNINVPYTSSNYVGFRYWGTAVNVIAPKVATAGNYFITIGVTNGTNTVYNQTDTGVLNISTLFPTVDQTYDSTSTNAQSGVAIAGVLGDIETLLSQI